MSAVVTISQNDTEFTNGKNKRPLVIDLDGTLIASDTLVESGIAYLVTRPLSVLQLLGALARGKAHLKDHIASVIAIDPALLPYDQCVIDYAKAAIADGRPVYLASACNQRYAAAVAEHLKLFDGVFASDRTVNLSAANKARKLVEAFGEGGFDYIGNAAADMKVWRKAKKAIAIRTSASVRKALDESGFEVEHLPHHKAGALVWIKLIRIHQYAKNALIFLPMFTAHRLDMATWLTAIVAFMAFSLCASSAYIINDLADMQADRAHPTKKNRPLASGSISPGMAMVLFIGLFVLAFALAASISAKFLAVLILYFVLTTAYTFYLKRKMIIDVIALASLYTIRIIAGAVAVSITVSDWLMVFSIFFFTSLALMKRYTELAVRLDKGLVDASNRNYQMGDLSVVSALSAAAGMNAVTIFALYLSSDAVRQLYTRPQLLWLICPLLMYWIGRALMMSHRRFMNDDPVVFAFRDGVSLATGAAVVAVVLAAI